VVVADMFFFQPVLRRALDAVESRTGYQVSYGSAEGSLLAGRLDLTGLRVLRDSDQGMNADLLVEHATFDLDTLSLLFRRVSFDRLAVEGVTGDLHLPSPGASGMDPDPAPRRRFRADRIDLARVSLRITQAGKPAHMIEIDSATAEPFRSTLALFDLFFRSTLVARLDGMPVLVETEVTSDRGRSTHFAFDKVPADVLAGVVPQAPMTWLQGGLITVRVEDGWTLDEGRIDMGWSIVLSNASVAPPPGAGAAERIALAALAKVVAERGGDVDLAFMLHLDGEDFSTSSRGDLSALWSSLREALVTGAADQGGGTAAQPDGG
jgi:hypothetical protein